MTKYARLRDDGYVIETHIGNPATDYVAAIAAEFVEVPDSVLPNDTLLEDGTWEVCPRRLEPEPPMAVEPSRITEAVLKQFMTRAERTAYKAAAGSDPIVEDFADMLALEPQDLANADTIEAIDKLEELNVLTAARAQALKDLSL